MAGGRIVYELGIREDLEIGNGVALRTAPGGGSFVGHQLNITSWGFYLITTVPVGFGTVQDGNYGSFPLTVPGARLGDKVEVVIPSLVTVGLFLQALVIANDSVGVSMFNKTGSPQTLSGSITVIIHPLPQVNE